MKKINFQYRKNQFPRAEKKVFLKRLLHSNFKIFSKALNKTILFLQDRKLVYTSQNKEFVKKTFPSEEETVFTASNI